MRLSLLLWDRDDKGGFPMESLTQVISAWETVRPMSAQQDTPYPPPPPCRSLELHCHECHELQDSSWVLEGQVGQRVVPVSKEGEARCGDAGLES